VADDAATLDPEQRRAAVFGGVDAPPDGVEGPPRERRAELAQRRARQLFPDELHQGLGQRFARLQRHVAGEAAHDDHVGPAAEDVSAFHVADEVQRGALQHLVDLAREVVALGFLLAHAHEAHARVGHVEHGGGVDLAHHRELLEVAGLAARVGAHVEHHRAAVHAGHDGGQGRPVHLLERAQRQLGDRPAGGGVARGEEGIGRAVAQQLERHLDRGALLERGARDGLGHPDFLGRVHDFDLEAGAARAAQLLGQHPVGPHQEHAYAQLAAGRHRALGHHPRSVVAAEGVHSHARWAGGRAQTSSTAITGLPL
jgi:hypothetical protein